MEKSEITRGQILYRLALSVVLSGAILLAINMLSPLIGAVYYAVNITLTSFIVAFAVLCVMLWLSFSALGYNVGEKGKVGFGRFLVLFIPSMIFWAFYGVIRMVISFIPLSSNSVMLLGFILSGRILTKIPATVSVQGFGLFWLISLVIHFAAAVGISYLFYCKGIEKRIKFREEILSGENNEIKPKKPLAQKLWYIPFANFVPFFPWIFKYYVYPEYKLRYLIPRLALIVAVVLGLNYSRKLIYGITETVWINIAYQAFTYYLMGLITSLIVLWDDKKNGERRGQKF